jgi:hypothetical protein
MGANLSCPPGFEDGTLFTCYAQCPAQYKRVQEPGGVNGPPTIKCVHVSQNSLFFPLTALPQVNRDEPIPTIFEDELKRVESEAQRLNTQARMNESVGDLREQNVREYSKIQSEYSAYKDSDSAAREIERVKNSLKPFRPPTAPASDLEKERKEITEIAKRNLFFVQAALFLVVLAMLSYLVLSLETANMISFALLCVGIAMGFFLRR